MEKAILDFIGNPYHWIIGASFSVNWFLARGWFKSHLEAESRSRAIKDIDENLNGAKSEIKTIQEKSDKTISSIKKENADIVKGLKHKIEVLENKNKIDVSKIQTKKESHW